MVWSPTTEGGFLISGIRPAKPSCVTSFCTNSSTFLMSVDTKLFTVFEVAWLLSFVHLCRHCHLCSWEVRGTGQKGFSKGFSYCRATAFWCQCHRLTQFPSCLFQHFVLVASQSSLYVVQDEHPSIHCLLHGLQFLLLLPQNFTKYYVSIVWKRLEYCHYSS